MVEGWIGKKDEIEEMFFNNKKIRLQALCYRQSAKGRWVIRGNKYYFETGESK